MVVGPTAVVVRHHVVSGRLRTVERHRNESVHVDGGLAWVTLDENLVAGEASGTIAATNLFALIGGSWKLLLHHGSPVMG